MKRSTSLLVALAAAAVTIGTLFAIAGPRNFSQYGYRNGRNWDCGRSDKTSGKDLSLPEKKTELKSY